jgi:hypothetical protein
VTSNALQLVKRVNGVDTVLKTAAMTVTAGLPGWLRMTGSGSSLTCTAYSDTNGVLGTQIASLTATDTAYDDGGVGMYSTNTTTTAGKVMTFKTPQMSAVSPASWSALTIAAGRPGEVPDQVTTPTGGNESLRLFSGATTYDGSVSQSGIAVAKSTPYTISAQIATSGLSTAAQAQVQVIESPSNTTTILSNSLANSAFTLNSFTFTTQATTTSVTIKVRLVGKGVANFDDLSLSVAPTVSLSLSTTAVSLGTISPLTSPITLLNATTATVVSNAGWTLVTSGSGAFSDGAGHTIPLSELAWRRNGTTAFTPFSTTAATVTTGAATTGTAVPLDYRLTSTYTDPASTAPYSTTVTYIATTP